MGGHALLQGIFPTQIEPGSLTSPVLADRFFTTSATWEVRVLTYSPANPCVSLRSSHPGERHVDLFLRLSSPAKGPSHFLIRLYSMFTGCWWMRYWSVITADIIHVPGMCSQGRSACSSRKQWCNWQGFLVSDSGLTLFLLFGHDCRTGI